MSSTLNLFWDLSSPKAKQRLDAATLLINQLQSFQSQFQCEEGSEDASFEALNSPDVCYAIRRLIRGLASPREGSRQGFAVSLAELLFRLDTVSTSHIIDLVVDASQSTKASSGQEERDALFARLFGITAILRSGLAFRPGTLPASNSKAPQRATLDDFKKLVSLLIQLANKKMWLREPSGWALCLAVDGLRECQIEWKQEAITHLLDALFRINSTSWSLEKVALWIKMRDDVPTEIWKPLLAPVFRDKSSNLLASANLGALARILKDTANPSDDSETLAGSMWRPQLHFVWSLILDHFLSPNNLPTLSSVSFVEFYRVIVDDTLFASTASSERKLWGFQIFQAALPRVSSIDAPRIFTPNFLRTWINHLAKQDRTLHAAARDVAKDVRKAVERDNNIGFPIYLQMTGAHGHARFDRVTRTKTLEGIITAMDLSGVEKYVEHLIKQFDGEESDGKTELPSDTESRQLYIVEQLTGLVRHGSTPKGDTWIIRTLNLLVLHGLFTVRKQDLSSQNQLLHTKLRYPVLGKVRQTCRERLLTCTAHLTEQSTGRRNTGYQSEFMTTSHAGGYGWASKTVSLIADLEENGKHVRRIEDASDEVRQLYGKARKQIEKLNKTDKISKNVAKGAELLLNSLLLWQQCMPRGENISAFEVAVEATGILLKERQSGGQEGADAILGILDLLISLLEEPALFTRTTVNHVFVLLIEEMSKGSVDLLLAQLDDTAPGAEDDDETTENSSGSDIMDGNMDSESEEDFHSPAMRDQLLQALAQSGVSIPDEDADSDETESLMDDDQMLQMDETLAEAFRSQRGDALTRKDNRGLRRATVHFRARVLDLVDAYLAQASDPAVLRCVLPLVKLVLGTSTDTRQLADKAASIVRSRFANAKHLLSSVDVEAARETLHELHTLAGLGKSAESNNIIAPCCLYVARNVINSGNETMVIDQYRESLEDFLVRKSSTLTPLFFTAFVERLPNTAWELRGHLLALLPQASNAYRQSQGVSILEANFAHLNTAVGFEPACKVLQLTEFHQSERIGEVQGFIKTFRKRTQQISVSACENELSMSAAQMKSILKSVHHVVRLTKRLRISQPDLSQLWKPDTWRSLAEKLPSAERFRSTPSLLALCRQIADAVNASETNASMASGKRKDATIGEELEAGKKRKKARRTSDTQNDLSSVIA